ncbi:MAG TPA: hypothetical protein VFS15_00995, partial [Kofleriaceae bacterium]|nr:hypothetical protein [Kofleriaceae bacterium]
PARLQRESSAATTTGANLTFTPVRAPVIQRQPSPCSTRFRAATSFAELIDLVRGAEARLAASGITSARDQIHALRGIYYGTVWSQDYAVEHSTTRNEGFQRFTRPSVDPSRSVPPDVRPILDCGLFEALRDSQDIHDPSGRYLDFGHLIIGLDARSDPAFASEVRYPVPTPLGGSIDIRLGGTGTELVTWLGDLGGGAASLAARRVNAPSTSAAVVFSGSDYGGSINLEGDVAASVVATSGAPTSLTAPSFGAGRRLSDVLQDYLSPGSTSRSWAERVTTFLRINGASFDASGTLTNRAALLHRWSSQVQTFACNYLASRVRDSRTTGITRSQAIAAAGSHVVTSANEVTVVFLDALEDARRSGGPIVARRFPSPSPSGASACTLQITAARAASVFSD